MTSSSDAALWQPFVPPATAALTLVREPGTFAPVSMPHSGAADDPTGWLPPLHTNADMARETAEAALQEEAYSRGADEAARAERARADARCATALEAVHRAAAHLEAIALEFARDRERDVQAVALAAARHIVQHELTIDTLRVGELVNRAIELLPMDLALEIRLNPADLETLRGGLQTLAPFGRAVTLNWLSDPSVERGGFHIETPHRIVDGRADVALRTLYERFDRD